MKEFRASVSRRLAHRHMEDEPMEGVESTRPISAPLLIEPSSSSAPPTSAAPSFSRTPSPSNSSLRTGGKAVILGTKMLRGLLHITPDFGPLPGMLDDIVEIVDIIGNKLATDDALKGLDKRLERVSVIIMEHIQGKDATEIPPAFMKALNRLAEGIHAIKEEAESFKSHGTLSTYIGARGNEMILGLNAKIDELVSLFGFEMQVANGLSAHNEKMKSLIRGLTRVPGAYNSGYSGSSATSQSRRRTVQHGTAQGILELADEWIDTESPRPSVFVLHGLAGMGKTTIAQTIAESRDKRLEPVASFFFIRNSLDRTDHFVSTIASQFAERNSSYSHHLSQYLDSVFDVSMKPFEEQLKHMIIEPLKKTRFHTLPLIIIDALDECDQNDASILLQSVLDNIPDLPFKVLLTCRMESHLDDILRLSQEADEMREQIRMLDMMEHMDDFRSDIQMFIQHELSLESVKRSFPLCDWHITSNDYIADAAGGLFIIATTMVDFIKDKVYRNPTVRLKVLLSILQKSDSSGANPYAPLDMIFVNILRTAVPDLSDGPLLKRYQIVVGALVTLRQPLDVTNLETLIGIDPGEVEGAIHGLSSVMRRRSIDRAPQFYHTAFTDFLTDKSRCGNLNIEGDPRFFIDLKEHDAHLADRCIDCVLRYPKKQNLLELSAVDCLKSHDQIPRLDQLIKTHISPVLLYSCRFWAQHLLRVMNPAPQLLHRIQIFAYRGILTWVEAIAWVDNLVRARSSAQIGGKFAAHHFPKNSPVSILFYDTERLLSGYHAVISKSPMHLHLSVLPSVPLKSALYAIYYKDKVHEVIQPVRIVRGQPETWTAERAVYSGHTGAVTCVALSPDHRHIASGSSDYTIRLWREDSPVLKGHTGPICSLAFSPDSKRLASTSEDKTVRIWNPITGESIIQLMGHTTSIFSIAFSPDGSRLATTDREIIRLWNGTTGESIAQLRGHTYKVRSVAFSPNGKWLASGSDDVTVRVWSAWSGRPLAEYEGRDGRVLSVAFSPDSERLASGSDDNIVRIWRVAKEAPFKELEGHCAEVHSVAFSPNNKLLASASGDKTIRLWDAVTGDAIIELGGHTGKVFSISFSPSSTLLASASEDKTIRLWEIVPGLLNPEVQAHTDLVTSVVCSPDGKRLASASDDASIILWDSLTGAPTAKLHGHAEAVCSISFSPDGEQLASGSEDQMVRVWNVETGERIAELQGHTNSVAFVAFSPDNSKRLASASDKTIRLWNLINGSLIAELQGQGEVSSIAFSPSGNHLAAAHSDTTVSVWDAITGLPVSDLLGHKGKVRSVSFSPDGQLLASASDDKIIKLWNTDSGKCVGELQGNTGWVRSVAFSLDGKQVLATSRDDTLRIWDVTTRATIAKLPCFPSSLDTLSRRSLASETLLVSRPNPDGLRYIFSLGEGDHSSRPRLYWIPVWLQVDQWWPLPSGGVFISNEKGQIYILEPNTTSQNPLRIRQD